MSKGISLPKNLRGDIIARCSSWNLEACIFKNQNLCSCEVSTNLDRPDVWDVRFGLYLPLSYAFYVPLYVIIAEVELHAVLLVLLVVDHYTNICRDCRASIALNNLCCALLFGNSLLDKIRLVDLIELVKT
jgi:hypothetical protein